MALLSQFRLGDRVAIYCSETHEFTTGSTKRLLPATIIGKTKSGDIILGWQENDRLPIFDIAKRSPSPDNTYIDSAEKFAYCLVMPSTWNCELEGSQHAFFSSYGDAVGVYVDADNKPVPNPTRTSITGTFVGCCGNSIFIGWRKDERYPDGAVGSLPSNRALAKIENCDEFVKFITISRDYECKLFPPTNPAAKDEQIRLLKKQMEAQKTFYENQIAKLKEDVVAHNSEKPVVKSERSMKKWKPGDRVLYKPMLVSDIQTAHRQRTLDDGILGTVLCENYMQTDFIIKLDEPIAKSSATWNQSRGGERAIEAAQNLGLVLHHDNEDIAIAQKNDLTLLPERTMESFEIGTRVLYRSDSWIESPHKERARTQGIPGTVLGKFYDSLLIRFDEPVAVSGMGWNETSHGKIAAHGAKILNLNLRDDNKDQIVASASTLTLLSKAPKKVVESPSEPEQAPVSNEPKQTEESKEGLGLTIGMMASALTGAILSGMNGTPKPNVRVGASSVVEEVIDQAGSAAVGE
jgi:hypothetical protein